METAKRDHEFNHEEGLKTIYDMIRSVKSSVGRNHSYYIMWGYLVLAACAGDYVMLKLQLFNYHYLSWTILMTAGCIATLYLVLRQKKSEGYSTYVGRFLGIFWCGWFISFLILMVFTIMKNDYESILPLSLAMYGLAIFVSGSVMRFMPLIIGAVLAWVAAIVSYMVPYQIQLLVMALTVTCSYLIPGYILKKEW